MNRRHLAALAVALTVGAVAAYGTVALPTDSFGGPAESPADADKPSATDAPDPTDAPNDTDASGDRELPYVAYSGDKLTLNATSDQIVRAETDLPAGTTVAIRVKSSGANPFIVSRDATVDDGGTATATFDLCDVTVEDSAAIVAYVAHDGERIANATGTVYAVENANCPSETPESSEARFVHDGERITLQSAPDQTVRAETDLPAGTEVAVRLRSSESAQPFLKSQEATVGEDGTVSATFNMSQIEPGIAFKASIHYDGERLATADGRVAE